MNFIEGKWYETKAGSFVKYKKTVNLGSEGIFLASEHFMYDSIEILREEAKFGEANINRFREISLDEIQEYLPDGHIDKYTTLNKEENYEYLIDILKKHNIN